VDIERKRTVQHITQAPVAMDCSPDVDDRENAFSADSRSTLPACEASGNSGVDEDMMMRAARQQPTLDGLLSDLDDSSCFPYANLTQALLHLWWSLAPVLPRRKMEMLFAILRHPGFRSSEVPSSWSSFLKLDESLGVRVPGMQTMCSWLPVLTRCVSCHACQNE
jgi:hypothetical protein